MRNPLADKLTMQKPKDDMAEDTMAARMNQMKKTGQLKTKGYPKKPKAKY